MKLTGKVALITNVSEFMGPAITEEFCREGAGRSTTATRRPPRPSPPSPPDFREALLTGDRTRPAEADRVVAAGGQQRLAASSSSTTAPTRRRRPTEQSPTRNGGR
jgi:NAD(P)-dependent dehydrogenase (short-subunit alcohol dehydrogenase family)